MMLLHDILYKCRRNDGPDQAEQDQDFSDPFIQPGDRKAQA
jgi:hypothetical protein